MDTRLPAHLEVAGFIRHCQALGGFAAVLRKGERDAGTILLVVVTSGNHEVFERMPQVDGTRRWAVAKSQSTETKEQIDEYLARRARQDDDLWIVELDIPGGERFVPET